MIQTSIIGLPFGGIDAGQPASGQKPGTTSDARNVRGTDPASGRARLSQRSGLSRHCSVPVGAGKAQALVELGYDGRKVAYSALASGAEVTSWSRGSRAGRAGSAAVLDRNDNVYAIDGASTVIMFNSAGVAQWSLKLPVEDQLHIVRALAVDDAGNLFAAVSEGGDQTKGRIWRFRRTAEQPIADPPRVVWTQSIDGYVADMKVRGDQLITAQNYPDRGAAAIVVYQGITQSGPDVAWQSDKVAYPVRAIATNDDGDVFATSPSNSTRGIDPRFPTFTESTVDWTLQNLDNLSRRLWARVRGASIVGLEENDAVDEWDDISGNGRLLFKSVLRTGDTAPVYNPKGIGGKPSVRFRGTTDALQSGQNQTTASGAADQQVSFLPTYQGGKWAMFMVVRPRIDKTQAARPQCLWSMQMSPDTGGSLITNEQQCWVNQIHNSTTLPGTATHGGLTWYTSVNATYPGADASGLPRRASFSPDADASIYYDGNNTGAFVLTQVFDNGLSPTVDNGTVTHSMLRVNGKPLDRWVSQPSVSLNPFYLGTSFGVATATTYFEGDIAEIIVLRDYDSAPAGLLSHPRYPRQVGALTTGIVHNTGSETEIEKIEAALMHEYRISHLAPTGTAVTASGATVATYNPGNYPHPYYRTSGPPRASSTATRSEPYRLHSPQPVTCKLDGGRGDLRWVCTSSGEDSGVGGMGLGIEVFQNRVFTVGQKVTGSGTFPTGGYVADLVDARCMIDLGKDGAAGYSNLFSRDAWIVAFGGSGDAWLSSRVGLGVDKWGNLYMPTDHAGFAGSLKVYSQKGGNTGAPTQMLSVATLPENVAGQTVLVERNPPKLRVTDNAGADFKKTPTTASEHPRVEHVYVLSDATTDGLWVHKLRLLDATRVAGAVLASQLYGVSQGAVKKVGTTTSVSPSGAGTLAQPELGASNVLISAAHHDGKLYLNDTSTLVVVDPIEDTVTKWEAQRGRIPPRCRLLTFWRGAAVLARQPDAPHAWYMSRVGDPNDWDYFPIPSSPTQAVAGIINARGISDAHDGIQALAPWNDEALVFLCDTTVWVMRGHPSSNGEFYLWSDEVGGVAGRSWCKSPSGSLYFVGARNGRVLGVYTSANGESPRSMTQARNLDARFAAINLATHYVHLEWSEVDDGLHLFVLPYDTHSATQTHWFWERSNDAWWTDTFGDASSLAVQPTAVASTTFGLLLGGQDGYVRKWDSAAKKDDQTAGGVDVPIDSYVRIGPLTPEDSSVMWRMSRLELVTASDQDTLWCKVLSANAPDAVPDERYLHCFEPGRSRVAQLHVMDCYHFVDVFSRNAARRWSIESMRSAVARGGRRRVR